MSRACCFCGASGVTAEHAWPQWIGKLVDRRPQRTTFGRNNRVITYDAGTRRTRIRVACGDCNSGWMSALEQAVQPFMTPMIAEGLATVLDSERLALASAWVMKTAMIFEHQSTRGLY